MFAYQTTEWIKQTRRKLRLNQTQFWAPLGVTQSAGSRYESRRDVPDPVRRLLAIAYGTEPQRFEALKFTCEHSPERTLVDRKVSESTQLKVCQRGGLYSLRISNGQIRQIHSQDSVLRTLANYWQEQAMLAEGKPVPATSPLATQNCTEKVVEDTAKVAQVLVELPAENGYDALTLLWLGGNMYRCNDQEYPAHAAIRWLGNQIYNLRTCPQSPNTENGGDESIHVENLVKGFVVSANGTWLSGVYATEEAARRASSLDPDDLAEIWAKALSKNPNALLTCDDITSGPSKETPAEMSMPAVEVNTCGDYDTNQFPLKDASASVKSASDPFEVGDSVVSDPALLRRRG